jgi:hypothetical protein
VRFLRPTRVRLGSQLAFFLLFLSWVAHGVPCIPGARPRRSSQNENRHASPGVNRYKRWQTKYHRLIVAVVAAVMGTGIGALFRAGADPVVLDAYGAKSF